jgi:predicted transcriptional regulator
LKPALTTRELDIMTILWDRGAATVAEVRAQLPDDLAYTTVLTVLRTLEAKGHVEHEDGTGRAYLYVPRTVRREAAREAIETVVKSVFQGSPELLILRVLTDYRIPTDQLRRIRDQADRLLASADSPISR